MLDGEGNKNSGEFGMEKTNESPENRSLQKICLDFTVSRSIRSGLKYAQNQSKIKFKWNFNNKFHKYVEKYLPIKYVGMYSVS